MQTQDDFNRKVEDTISVLSEIKTVKSNPFLYEKIKSKLEEESSLTLKSNVWKLQILGSFAMVVLIMLNVFTIQKIHKPNNFEADLSNESIDYIIKSYGIEVEDKTLIYN